MSYTVTWPVGTLSVGANNATGVANSLFVQDNMQADHYFNEGATKEGHHKFAKMTISGTLSAPDDPGVANVDATYYTRYNKTPTETDQTQNVQPFFETSWGQMQLLGIRAHGLVAVSSVTGVMTVHSSFNCTITRQGVWDASTNVGKFLCTFAPPCPKCALSYVWWRYPKVNIDRYAKCCYRIGKFV